MAAKQRPRKTAPHVRLATSDPVEAVEYVFLLLEMGAAGREDRDPSGAAAVRETIDTVRDVMKLANSGRPAQKKRR